MGWETRHGDQCYLYRRIVRAASLYERYHTLADDIDPDCEAYLTPFDYPPGDPLDAYDAPPARRPKAKG